MSSEKHLNLQMHKWTPTDYVQMAEFNDNFGKIDGKIGEHSTQMAETMSDLVTTHTNLGRYNLVSDANYYDESTKRWYTDSTKTKLSTDNWAVIQEWVSAGDDIRLSDTVFLPKGKYYISKSIKQVGNKRFILKGYNATLCTDDAFVGNYIFQNFENEVDPKLDIDNYLEIDGIWFNNKKSGVIVIGVQSFFEQSCIKNIIFMGVGKACIKTFGNNGGIIDRIVVYGTSTTNYDSELIVSDGGTDVQVSNWVTSPHPHADSIFKVYGVAEVYFSNIHSEAKVSNDSLADHKAIIELKDVAGFGIRDSGFYNTDTNVVNYSLIDSYTTLGGGYGITHPKIDNLLVKYQWDYTYNKPMIVDASQPTRKVINIPYTESDVEGLNDMRGFINYYDGNLFSYQLTNQGYDKMKIHNGFNFSDMRRKYNDLIEYSFDLPDNSLTIGYKWSTSGGTWGIKNKQAYCTSPSASSVAYIDAGFSNAIVSAKVKYSSSEGVIARYIDSGNFILARINSGALNLFRFAGGTGNPIGNYSFTTVGGSLYEVKLVCNGSTIEVYLDNVLRITTTETAYQTATKHGLRVTSSVSGAFDDFRVEKF